MKNIWILARMTFRDFLGRVSVRREHTVVESLTLNLPVTQVADLLRVARTLLGAGLPLQIGRVVAQLKAMGELENTVIFFLSDNGASAEIMVRDGGHDRSAPPGGRVLVTGTSATVDGDVVAVGEGVTGSGVAERTLTCFDRQDGRLLWQEGAEWKEEEATHGTNPLCSASPVTDGERVVAWFGSAGLFCYDLQGHLLWKRELGVQRHIWGYGSSPVLHGDLCFLHFGPGERTFLLAVNKNTGETVWQHDEPINKEGTSEAKFSNVDYYGSWSTPLIREANGRSELIVSSPFRVCSFDPGTGKELWTCTGINALVYTSPLFADGIIVAMGGFGGMTGAVKAGGGAPSRSGSF